MESVKKEFLGAPIYVWLAGLAAFGLGVFVFMRRKASGGTATSGTAATPVTPGGSNAAPYPYPLYYNASNSPSDPNSILNTPVGLTGTPISTLPTPVSTPANPAITPGPVSPVINPTFPSLETFIGLGATGKRGDIQNAINQGRWTDITGEYAKEVASWKAAHPTGTVLTS